MLSLLLISPSPDADLTTLRTMYELSFFPSDVSPVAKSESGEGDIMGAAGIDDTVLEVTTLGGTAGVAKVACVFSLPLQ